MCGIAGYFQLEGKTRPDRDLIGRMVNVIRHRGPDEFGAFMDSKCVLGQARLSIIDLAGGSQPMANEDGTVWITFNGEIFNYVELRPELEELGHRFRTHSDTEVIIHAWEQWGKDCLERFNGQFAFAIYDRRKETLFVARDRLGIRPLFYTIHNLESIYLRLFLYRYRDIFFAVVSRKTCPFLYLIVKSPHIFQENKAPAF